MKTLKLWAIISTVVALAGWRTYAALSALDPQIPTAINEAAPRLTLWVEIDLVLLVLGFLAVAGYAVFNEREYERKIKASYSDFRKHAEDELTSEITRAVRSEYRDYERALDLRQCDLEEAEKSLSERQETLALCERAVHAKSQANKELHEELAPLRRVYEDGKSTLNSLLSVLQEDSAETLKALAKVASWARTAIETPDKFISDVKAGRVNSGWVERLEREQQYIDVRTEGTRKEAEQVDASVKSVENSRKKGIPL